MKKIFLILSTLLLVACTTKTEIVYQSVYPDLPQVESPLILSTLPCKFTYPENDSKIFVGYDKENFKCYLKNQEINREQRLLYEQFIEEINKERLEWSKLNSKNKH